MSDSGYLTIGKLKMYYEIHGSGEPLVLLHGGGSGIDATFGRILPELARTRQIIAFEQQGHGHTADIDRPFSLEQMAEDTAKALDELHIGSADVFGFSNGGHIAMHLTINYPEKVKKLILASTFYKNEGVIPELHHAWAAKVHAEDMPETLRNEYYRVAPNPDSLESHVQKSQAMMRQFKDIPSEKLKNINKSVLIIAGDHDVTRPEHSVEMMRLLPESRLVILPGTHGAYIGELSTPHVKTKLPEITTSIITEFLEGFQV